MRVILEHKKTKTKIYVETNNDEGSKPVTVMITGEIQAAISRFKSDLDYEKGMFGHIIDIEKNTNNSDLLFAIENLEGWQILTVTPPNIKPDIIPEEAQS